MNREKLNELALCSGIAGISLGLQRTGGFRTVCHVEREPYCVEVLRARMRDGSLDPCPIWDDLYTFDGRPWRGPVDLISAGFPCQPVSLAGKRQGERDERFLWPEVSRVIAEVGPRWVLLENVPGLLCPLRSAGDAAPAAIGRVLGELFTLGYDAEWTTVRASDAGAPHRRERVFILAYRSPGINQESAALGDSQCSRLSRINRRESAEESQDGYVTVADPAGRCRDIQPERERREWAGPTQLVGLGRGPLADSDRRRWDGRQNDLGRQALPDQPERRGPGVEPEVPDEQGTISGRRGVGQAHAPQWRSPVGSRQQRHSGPGWPSPDGDRCAVLGAVLDRPESREAQSPVGGTPDGVPSGLDRSRPVLSRGCPDSGAWPGKRPIQETSAWEQSLPRTVTFSMNHRANRLKCLGNAVVPQVAEHIGRLILEAEQMDFE